MRKIMNLWSGQTGIITETWRQTGSCSDFCQYKQTLDGEGPHNHFISSSVLFEMRNHFHSVLMGGKHNSRNLSCYSWSDR